MFQSTRNCLKLDDDLENFMRDSILVLVVFSDKDQTM